MEALAATLAAKEDAMAAINAMVQQGLELQDILVLLGDELGLDLVVEDEDGNEVEEDLDDVESDDDDEEGDDMATASQEADDVGGGSSSTAGFPAARRSRRLVASSLIRDAATSRNRTTACAQLCGGDFMGQVAAHLVRNPADGIRLLMDPVLKAVLAKEAAKDPQVQAALACLSGARMLSPI